jgi:hypothetical protein
VKALWTVKYWCTARGWCDFERGLALGTIGKNYRLAIQLTIPVFEGGLGGSLPLAVERYLTMDCWWNVLILSNRDVFGAVTGNLEAFGVVAGNRRMFGAVMGNREPSGAVINDCGTFSVATSNRGSSNLDVTLFRTLWISITQGLVQIHIPDVYSIPLLYIDTDDQWRMSLRLKSKYIFAIIGYPWIASKSVLIHETSSSKESCSERQREGMRFCVALLIGCLVFGRSCHNRRSSS